MAEEDYRAEIGRDDFLASLREMSAEEITYKLKTREINDNDKRALAEIELDGRRDDSELARCKRQLHNQKIATWAVAAAAFAAIASATAAWWPE